jgi:hypothetical protein
LWNEESLLLHRSGREFALVLWKESGNAPHLQSDHNFVLELLKPESGSESAHHHHQEFKSVNELLNESERGAHHHLQWRGFVQGWWNVKPGHDLHPQN